MKIYYHAQDLDGRCSGAIVARRYPHASIVPYNYWYDTNYTFFHEDRQINKNEELIFVDICPRMEVLDIIMDITTNITVIDHHITAYNDVTEAKLPINLVYNGEYPGACYHVWKYYYPDKPVPEAVQLIAERDMWIRTKPDHDQLHFGLSSLTTFPTSRHWDRLLADHQSISTIKAIGKNIVGYVKPWYATLLRLYSIEGMIGDKKAIFLNQGAVDSMVFDEVAGRYQIYARGTYAKDCSWHISLTSDRDKDVDVSIIARRHSGGGHKTAAGFKVDSLDEFILLDKK